MATAFEVEGTGCRRKRRRICLKQDGNKHGECHGKCHHGSVLVPVLLRSAPRALVELDFPVEIRKTDRRWCSFRWYPQLMLNLRGSNQFDGGECSCDV